MDIYWVVFKLSLLIAGVAFVLLSVKLYQKYSNKYLLFFVYFLIFINIYGFFNIVGKAFAQNVLYFLQISGRIGSTLGLVFHICSAPFLIIAVYFFIAMIAELSKIIIKPTVRYTFFIFMFGLLIRTGYQEITNLKNGVMNFYPGRFNPFLILNTSLLVGIILILSFALVKKKISGRNAAFLKGIKIFYVLYLITFITNYIITDLLEYSCYRYSLAEYFMHLIPIYYLKYFLNQNTKNTTDQFDQSDINWFLNEYNISKREWDIISLMLIGKSNRDIEEKLFISINTVKSHIYNIYQKTGIKSRWELIALLNKFKKN